MCYWTTQQSRLLGGGLISQPAHSDLLMRSLPLLLKTTSCLPLLCMSQTANCTHFLSCRQRAWYLQNIKVIVHRLNTVISRVQRESEGPHWHALASGQVQASLAAPNASVCGPTAAFLTACRASMRCRHPSTRQARPAIHRHLFAGCICHMFAHDMLLPKNLPACSQCTQLHDA